MLRTWASWPFRGAAAPLRALKKYAEGRTMMCNKPAWASRPTTKSRQHQLAAFWCFRRSAHRFVPRIGRASICNHESRAAATAGTGGMAGSREVC